MQSCRRNRKSPRVMAVNRHTVRRAMAELAVRGLVRTERGSGTFVKTDKLDYRIGRRTRFSEIVAAARPRSRRPPARSSA